VKEITYFAFVRGFLKIILNLLYKIEAEGTEHLPKNGPYIIASKHASFLDSPFIALYVPRLIHWIVAKSIWQHWFLHPWCRLASCVPINGSVDGALSLIRHGGVIGIFPEGHITNQARLQKIRSGIAVLSMKMGTPIIPCFIAETTSRKMIGITLPKLFSSVFVCRLDLEIRENIRHFWKKDVIIRRKDPKTEEEL